MKFRSYLSLALLTAALPFSSAVADEDLVYVQTRNAAIQTEPKLLSKPTKRLTYGDALLVLSKNNSWYKVRSTDKAEGYIHVSAISTRKLTLSGGKTGDSRVADSEISLAGKGFSPEIEKQLASQNHDLNFKGVDAMEKISVSPEQVRAFVKNGQLNQDAF